MTETRVQTQVRLVLEQECARLFTRIAGAPCECEEHPATRLVDIGFTLLVFDYGELCNVAFKTTLNRRRLRATARWLLKRWESGAPIGQVSDRVLSRHRLVALSSLLALGAHLRRLLPREQGYALIVGAEPWARYISSGDREGVAAMLRDELLPQWEAG